MRRVRWAVCGIALSGLFCGSASASVAISCGTGIDGIVNANPTEMIFTLAGASESKTTNAASNTGSATISFATNTIAGDAGKAVTDVTNPRAIPAGTTVSSGAGTSTITLSQKTVWVGTGATTASVASGDTITFGCLYSNMSSQNFRSNIQLLGGCAGQAISACLGATVLDGSGSTATLSSAPPAYGGLGNTGVLMDGMTISRYGGTNAQNNANSQIYGWNGWVFRNMRFTGSSGWGVQLAGSATLVNSLVDSNMHGGVVGSSGFAGVGGGPTISGNEVSFNNTRILNDFVNTTGTPTNGSGSVTVTSGTGIVNGSGVQDVTHPSCIPLGFTTTVTAGGGTTSLTISPVAGTTCAASDSLQFSLPNDDYTNDAAAIKVASTGPTAHGGILSSTTFLNNYIHDNQGTGIWSDVQGTNFKMIGNTIINNANNGIHYETSTNCEIAYNVINNNGNGPQSTTGTGIYIPASSGCAIYNNNILVPTTKGQGWIVEATSRADAAPLQTSQVQFFNNVVTFAGSNGVSGFYNPNGTQFYDTYSNNNAFHTNSSCSTDTHWFWNIAGETGSTFATYKTNSSQDAGSTCDTTAGNVAGCTHIGCQGSGWPLLTSNFPPIIIRGSNYPGLARSTQFPPSVLPLPTSCSGQLRGAPYNSSGSLGFC